MQEQQQQDPAAGTLEETFTRLQEVMQRLPASEHTPEMLQLEASRLEFRQAVNLGYCVLEAAQGQGPSLPEGQLVKLKLAFLRSCSLGLEAMGAYSMPFTAQRALGVQLGLGSPSPANLQQMAVDPDPGPLLSQPLPPIGNALQALDAICLGALFGTVAMEGQPETTQRYRAAGLARIDAGFSSLWPQPPRARAMAQMAAQGWVPAAPAAAASQPHGGDSASSGANAPLAPGLAVLLRHLRPDLSLADLQRCCLVLRCSIRFFLKAAAGTESAESQDWLRDSLVDCQRLLRLDPGCMYARQHAAGVLDDKPWPDSRSDAVALEWAFLHDSLDLALRTKWYRAATQFQFYMAVRLVDSAAFLARQSPPVQRHFFATARIPSVPGALMDRVAELMQGTKELERKLRAWLPSRRLLAVTQRRRQIEAHMAEFRSSGGVRNTSVSVDLSKSVCAACGEPAFHLRACSACGSVRYCSRECQRKDWKEGGHKQACARLAAQRKGRGG